MGNVASQGPVRQQYYQQGQQPQRQQGQQQQQQQAPRGSHVINDEFWATRGIHWDGNSTHGILHDPQKAFGNIPNGAEGDTSMALGFEQHIFSTICGMIRSRAYQLNDQAYPSDSNFFRSYTITLGSHRKWNGAGVLRIIERLRFNCAPPSNQRAGVTWEAHQCNIHHLPRDNSNILQLLGRSEGSPHDAKLEDRATVEYMGDIYKFEFQEFQKQQRRDPTLTLQNVQFVCEGPSNAGQGLVELQGKWNTMWDASAIHPHGGGPGVRSRVGHLRNGEDDPMHSQGDHVRSRARHPRDAAGLQGRHYNSEGHKQDQQMRHRQHWSEGAQTETGRFWAALHENPEALLHEGREAEMRRTPQYAGGGGGNITDAAYGSGFGHGGNGIGFPRAVQHHIHGENIDEAVHGSGFGHGGNGNELPRPGFMFHHPHDGNMWRASEQRRREDEMVRWA
jgi:hypothetical protein